MFLHSSFGKLHELEAPRDVFPVQKALGSVVSERCEELRHCFEVSDGSVPRMEVLQTCKAVQLRNLEMCHAETAVDLQVMHRHRTLRKICVFTI